MEIVLDCNVDTFIGEDDNRIMITQRELISIPNLRDNRGKVDKGLLVNYFYKSQPIHRYLRNINKVIYKRGVTNGTF